MGLRIQTGVVGCEKEAVAYTYNEPGSGNVFPAFDINVSFAGDGYQRKETRPILDKAPEIPGPAEGTISFKVLDVGGAAAGTAPYFKEALYGCGLRSLITSVTSVVFEAWSTFDGATAAGPPVLQNPFQSYSISVWEDGVRYALKGAMGNMVMRCKMGEPRVLEFTFTGAYVATAADSPATPATLPLPPQPFLGSNILTITTGGAWNPIFDEFSLDLGNVLSKVINANDASGIRGSQITDRRIVAKINPELPLPATKDLMAIWRAGTVATLAAAITTGAAGNKWALAIPKSGEANGGLQFRIPQMGDREAQRIVDIEMPLVGAAAEGGSFQITWT
jgi:hypothetical protein